MTFNYKQFPALIWILSLCFSVSLEAQEELDKYHRLTISFTAKGAEKAKHIQLSGKEAATFDIEAYLKKHIQEGHIKIHGTTYTDLEITRLRFDSNDLPEGEACTRLCRKVVKEEQKPILGVSVDHTNDFEGVWINRTLDGTAASNIGLAEGDVITSIDENNINSGCDLRTVIRQYEIGAEVKVKYERDGQILQTPTNLSFQNVKEISWAACCNELENPVSEIATSSAQQLQVFPNPTRGMTQIIFNSTDKGDFQINVTDVSGRIIYEEAVNDFDGVYKKHLNLMDQAAGVYFLNVIQGQEVQTKKIVLQHL